MTMRTITIGFDTHVRIPECWDAFVFQGWRYVKGDDGRFLAEKKVA